MSITNTFARRYQYELFSPDRKNPDKPSAAIYLYGDSDKLLGCIFFSDQAEFKEPVEENGIVIVSSPNANFERMIDMLRNEKPVIFCWDNISRHLRICTGNEPVGEEELKRLFSFLYI